MYAIVQKIQGQFEIMLSLKTQYIDQKWQLKHL